MGESRGRRTQEAQFSMSGLFVVIRMRSHCFILEKGFPRLPGCRAMPPDLLCLPHKCGELVGYRGVHTMPNSMGAKQLAWRLRVRLV